MEKNSAVPSVMSLGILEDEDQRDWGHGLDQRDWGHGLAFLCRPAASPEGRPFPDEEAGVRPRAAEVACPSEGIPLTVEAGRQ